MSPANPTIDVRVVPPPRRHPLIFGTFDALPTGGALVIVNDHDPLPLYLQFEAARFGQFEWSYLDAGPELWRVRIGKLVQGQPTGQPQGCGSACGCVDVAAGGRGAAGADAGGVPEPGRGR